MLEMSLPNSLSLLQTHGFEILNMQFDRSIFEQILSLENHHIFASYHGVLITWHINPDFLFTIDYNPIFY